MVLQVGMLGEPSRADVALERPRPRMDVHVRPQVPWGWKRLAAQAALVWFVLKQN